VAAPYVTGRTFSGKKPEIVYPKYEKSQMKPKVRPEPLTEQEIEDEGDDFFIEDSFEV
jgi:hypothetical protein